MTPSITTLLDTSNLNDALACGYGQPVDASEVGLKIEYQCKRFPQVTLFSFGGEVTLLGEAEIRETIRALNRALALAAKAKETSK